MDETDRQDVICTPHDILTWNSSRVGSLAINLKSMKIKEETYHSYKLKTLQQLLIDWEDVRLEFYERMMDLLDDNSLLKIIFILFFATKQNLCISNAENLAEKGHSQKLLSLRVKIWTTNLFEIIANRILELFAIPIDSISSKYVPQLKRSRCVQMFHSEKTAPLLTLGLTRCFQISGWTGEYILNGHNHALVIWIL